MIGLLLVHPRDGPLDDPALGQKNKPLGSIGPLDDFRFEIRQNSAGNVYRHDYEDVREFILWRTIRESLPVLKAVIENEISLVS